MWHDGWCSGLAKGGSDLGANLNAKCNDGYGALYRVATKGENRSLTNLLRRLMVFMRSTKIYREMKQGMILFHNRVGLLANNMVARSVPSKELHILESIRSHFFNGHDQGCKRLLGLNGNNIYTSLESSKDVTVSSKTDALIYPVNISRRGIDIQLGEAAFILGIKIYRDMSKRLIRLGQNAYMDKILKRYKMDNSKRDHIPMIRVHVERNFNTFAGWLSKNPILGRVIKIKQVTIDSMVHGLSDGKS
ncbi:hypothetical protein Tco_0633605 [Tanacetum coccineum]